MDNQVIGAIFPTVIAIVPLPKSVAYDCGMCGDDDEVVMMMGLG